MVRGALRSEGRVDCRREARRPKRPPHKTLERLSQTGAYGTPSSFPRECLVLGLVSLVDHALRDRVPW